VHPGFPGVAAQRRGLRRHRRAGEIAIANQGFSNCFAGIALGPHGSCFLGVGIVAGAPAPSNALLVLQSNDPVQPETDIQLGLAP